MSALAAAWATFAFSVGVGLVAMAALMLIDHFAGTNRRPATRSEPAPRRRLVTRPPWRLPLSRCSDCTRLERDGVQARERTRCWRCSVVQAVEQAERLAHHPDARVKDRAAWLLTRYTDQLARLYGHVVDADDPPGPWSAA